MRFLVDECVGPAVARWLKERHHDVLSVYDEARGMTDELLVERARAGDWILITNDKALAGAIYRDRRPHQGVILLRLEDERSSAKVKALERLLARYEDDLPGSFVVVTESRARFARA